MKEEYPKILTGSDLGLVTLRPEVRTSGRRALPNFEPYRHREADFGKSALKRDLPRPIAAAYSGISLLPRNFR
jgi:hypothetical protein